MKTKAIQEGAGVGVKEGKATEERKRRTIGVKEVRIGEIKGQLFDAEVN